MSNLSRPPIKSLKEKNPQSPVKNRRMTIEPEPEDVIDNSDSTTDSDRSMEITARKSPRLPKKPQPPPPKTQSSSKPSSSFDCDSERQSKQPIRNTSVSPPTLAGVPASATNFWRVFVPTVLVCCLAAIIGYWQTDVPPRLKLLAEVDRNQLLLNKFRNQFTALKSNFPSQSSKTLNVINVAVKSILQTDTPAQPAVIALLAPPKAMNTLSCFAKKLSVTIEETFREDAIPYIHVDGVQHTEETAGKVKHLLESEAQKGFDNGSHAYLVENVDKLPGESVMIFHGLCDNENAPHKRVVYIMTLTLDPRAATDLKEVDVSHAWPQLNRDTRGALESRIGVNKVLIENEEDDIIKQTCMTTPL